MDGALSEMMADTCVVTSQDSTGSTASMYGIPTYTTGSASTYACYFERVRRQVRDPQGQTISLIGTLYVSSTSPIHPNDKVTLSDGSNPAVLWTDAYQDDLGLYGQVVHLGFR